MNDNKNKMEEEKDINPDIMGDDSFLAYQKKQGFFARNQGIILWSSLILIALIIAALGYFIFSSYINPHGKVLKASNSEQESSGGSSDEQSAGKNYTIPELLNKLEIKNSINWHDALAEGSKIANYFLLKEDKSWIVNIDDSALAKLKKYLSDYEIESGDSNMYQLRIIDLPYKNNKYKVSQLLDRVRFLGYKPKAIYPNKQLAINVAPFTSIKKARDAGERIYFYYRNAELFLANFMILHLSTTTDINPDKTISIGLNTKYSLSDGKDRLTVLETDYPDQFIYLKSAGENKYTIFFSYIKNQQVAESLLTKLKSEYPEALLINSQS